MELSALPLPPHPHRFPRVPDAPPLQEEEPSRAVGRRPVAAVQLFDRPSSRDEEGFVGGSRLLRRVQEVGEERESDVFLGGREVVDLDSLGELPHLFRALEKGGDHDERLEIRRHASRQFELGKTAGPHELGDVAVDQGDRDFGRGDEREERQDDELPGGFARHRRKGERHREQRDGGDENRADVAGGRRCEVGAAQPLGERDAVSHLPLELGPAAGDQEVAGVGLPFVTRSARRLGAPDDAFGDLDLVQPGSTGEVLDRVPITVAGGEIHFGDPRPAAQRLFDEADGFEEVGPVDRGNVAHARDHVAHGHVRRDLFLVLEPHDLVGSQALLLDPFRQPGEGRGPLRVALPQPLEQVDRKGRREGLAVERPHRFFPRLSRRFPDAEEGVGERLRLLAGDPATDDALGQPAQVLDQDEAQRDRDGPELSHGERLRGLIRDDEAPQGFGVEPAVGVRDEGRRQRVNAGIALERSGVELRKLAVVVLRHVVANLPQLLLDDVEVVDEPLGGGRDRPFFADRVGHRPIGLEQNAAVLAETGEERAPLSEPVREPVLFSERARGLLQPLGRVELRPDRLLEAGKGEDRGLSRVPSHFRNGGRESAGLMDPDARRSCRAIPLTCCATSRRRRRWPPEPRGGRPRIEPCACCRACPIPVGPARSSSASSC